MTNVLSFPLSLRERVRVRAGGASCGLGLLFAPSALTPALSRGEREQYGVER